MEIPEYGADFLRDALRHRESLPCLGRKNAKSAVCAIYLLGRMVGPLFSPGWRGAVCSVNKEKAGELKRQMQEIAEASNLEGLRFLRSPAPGRVEAPDCTLDVLSADASSGHASGFDDVVVDETGLLQERDRALINGLRSSVSARDGRVIHLSIFGSGPFVPELIEAADDPGVAVHLYQADESSDLEDPAAWHAANPGLGTIKSRSYMQDRARLAARNPADAADFMAHDLNRPGEPSREMICTVADWQRVAAADLDEPERRGPVVVGLDAGGSTSMTAAVCIWPRIGRFEARGAFPDTSDLPERGRLDGVGRRYGQLHALGEVRHLPRPLNARGELPARLGGRPAGRDGDSPGCRPVPPGRGAGRHERRPAPLAAGLAWAGRERHGGRIRRRASLSAGSRRSVDHRGAGSGADGARNQ
ncbi:MAG: terminase large subunit [Spirochaetaceae bacterium]|nr:terminase large subunit [Spirochaetaceae bacterium]